MGGLRKPRCVKTKYHMFGIPYMGSKTKVISGISRYFPNADHFYDLFGGGFSVTHFMLENRNNSYKHFHFNEISPGVCDLVKDAIAGKYSYKNFRPEWVSREKFLKEKGQSAYTRCLWSFGSNQKDYLFGKDIENQKRSMHQAVVFDEFDSWFIENFKINKWPYGLDVLGKRLYLRKIIKDLKACGVGRRQLQRLEQLERLQRLQQLQQLERLERLERLHFSDVDYRKVKIEKNSVIYCDIPYENTVGYSTEFSHKEFFDWVEKQNNPVFVSEYGIKDKRFYLLKEFSHRSTFSAGGLKNIPVTERLYGNKIAYDIIQKARSGTKHG